MMLKSLFGELGAIGATSPEPHRGTPEFAATAILESTAAELNDRGQMVDRHLRDLFVTGSPATAMRDHFTAARADLETAGRMLTLIDPARLWATAVIKALSDASGQPIERLHLREQATLRSLAMIERTTVVRRLDDMLKVYHADVRADGVENTEISTALMERSHMTVVIIGPMAPSVVDGLLSMLQSSVSQPTWRCPALVFMLPPGAAWLASKVSGIEWPAGLHVRVISESMPSASSVWNSLLGVWTEVRALRPWDASAQPASSPTPATGGPPALEPTRPAALIDPKLVSRTLAQVLAIEGLLGCALIDSDTGQVLARESREDQPLDIAAAAQDCAPLLRAHRDAAHRMGLAGGIDEIVVSGRAHQQIVRALHHHPALFVVALLERQRANQALARFRLADAVKNLV